MGIFLLLINRFVSPFMNNNKIIFSFQDEERLEWHDKINLNMYPVFIQYCLYTNLLGIDFISFLYIIFYAFYHGIKWSLFGWFDRKRLVSSLLFRLPLLFTYILFIIPHGAWEWSRVCDTYILISEFSWQSSFLYSFIVPYSSHSDITPPPFYRMRKRFYNKIMNKKLF